MGGCDKDLHLFEPKPDPNPTSGNERPSKVEAARRRTAPLMRPRYARSRSARSVLVRANSETFPYLNRAHHLPVHRACSMMLRDGVDVNEAGVLKAGDG